VKSSLRREPDVPGDLLRAIFGNVTKPSKALTPDRKRRSGPCGTYQCSGHCQPWREKISE
jgi:hypothetical protein